MMLLDIQGHPVYIYIRTRRPGSSSIYIHDHDRGGRHWMHVTWSLCWRVAQASPWQAHFLAVNLNVTVA